MCDLAQELEISRKTLYARFPGKLDLPEVVLAEKFASIEPGVKPATHAPSRDFFATLPELLAATGHELAAIKPPFVRDMRQRTPQMFKAIEQRRGAPIERDFGEPFRQGQCAGMVRRRFVRLMIELLVIPVRSTMNPAGMEELGMLPREGFGGIRKSVLEGALTAKGRKS